MVRAASQNALKDVQADLLNLFAPKGYVLGKREKKGKSIFRISIGSEQGIIPGNKVVFFSERERVHPITKKVGYDKIPLAEGTVSNLVTGGEAWVIPEDEEKSRRIRLGDQIEVIHKKSTWMNLFRP
jgi:hypothetical protein